MLSFVEESGDEFADRGLYRCIHGTSIFRPAFANLTGNGTNADLKWGNRRAILDRGRAAPIQILRVERPSAHNSR